MQEPCLKPWMWLLAHVINGSKQIRNLSERINLIPKETTNIDSFFIIILKILATRSLTRDQTYAPCIRRWSLNWTTREVPVFKTTLDSQVSMSNTWVEKAVRP